MQYRKKIIELLNIGNPTAIIDWLQEHPYIQQPDLIRQMKIVAEEEYGNLNDTNFISLLQDLTKCADDYEEKILDEQLASLKYDVAKADMEKSLKEMADTTTQIRAYVIECIVTNAANALQMVELAQQIIKLEKDSGTYDAKNWEAIL
jgi:hypothetical protein